MRRPGTTFPAGPVALGTSSRVEIRDELDWATRSTPHLSSLMEHVICLGRQSGKNSVDGFKPRQHGFVSCWTVQLGALHAGALGKSIFVAFVFWNLHVIEEHALIF